VTIQNQVNIGGLVHGQERGRKVKADARTSSAHRINFREGKLTKHAIVTKTNESVHTWEVERRTSRRQRRHRPPGGAERSSWWEVRPKDLQRGPWDDGVWAAQPENLLEGSLLCVTKLDARCVIRW
jgi:hypothetical protein